MKHPFKAISDERKAVIAHIERKASAVAAKADAGQITRPFAEEVRRVLHALIDDLKAEFHLEDCA
jgi:vacuolar-type H+-ATPase subunit H